jgi:transposase
MAYIKTSKEQNWLLPPSIKELIPKDHICFLVEDFVNSLDFTKFDKEYEGAGAPAYHPRIDMKILLMGMLSKVRSSRKLANACRENFVFMYLSEKTEPNFRTLARFRTENATFVKEAFVKTIELAKEYDLVDLSFICIDGTKIKANAGKKMSVKKEAIDKLDKIVEKMIEDDIAQDELDMGFYGDKEENLTGMDRRDMKKIVREWKRAQDKNKVKKNLEKVKEEAKRDPKQKRLSLSDPECRMMMNKNRVSQMAYNAQISVDSKNQIIVATGICQVSHDANQLVPQVEAIEENVGKLLKGTKIGADCGYSSADNYKSLEDKKLDGYIPSRVQAQELNGKETTLKHDNYEYDEEKDELIVGKDKFYYKFQYTRKNGMKILSYYNDKLGKKKDVPYYFRERLRMKKKMETQEAKEIYSLRQAVAEPPFANIKQNLGFREFLLRGKEKVKIEFDLVAMAHNLRKVWNKWRIERVMC